jgi:hypothetical protein
VAASALVTLADLTSALLLFAWAHEWRWHGLLRAWVRREAGKGHAAPDAPLRFAARRRLSLAAWTGAPAQPTCACWRSCAPCATVRRLARRSACVTLQR